MTCPACGAENDAGSRFCSSCGNALSTGGDQRRVATVLFGDLVGFTSLSESRDPEHVKALVDRCFERLAADVVAYGGRVDKIIGDAIVALFGAPVAHEDDPERAVRAALQMQSTLRTLSVDLDAELAMRIGVNTGEVLVGAVRVGDDYTAMGDVVNTASRLQTAAGVGEVLVGEQTHAATVDVVRYGERRQVEAKGKNDPVAAWVASEVSFRPGRKPRRRRAGLVGRDAERSLLCASVQLAVRHHRAQVISITGEAGVGKSRLAEDLAEHAAGEHGAFVLEGRCVPYGTANVWFPIADALSGACGIHPDDDVAVVRQKCHDTIAAAVGADHDVDSALAVFQYLLGDESAMAAVDPARIRDDVAVQLIRVLGALSDTRPVVVVLSDVHWADDRVLHLVDKLVRGLSHRPLVAALTSRPELTERWTPGSGRHNVIELHLDPLGPESAVALLDELAGDAPLSSAVREQLLERSGGNPLFLEEMVSLLTEPSSVSPDGRPAPAVSTDRIDADLPATLRGLVAARLDAVGPTTRAVLEDAAVIGRTGPLEGLAELASNRGDTDRSGAVRELVDRDLLEVVGDTFEFRSDLVRDVAYSTLTRADRARRHATVARWLERQASAHGRDDEVVEMLAHHWGSAAEHAVGLGDVAGVPAEVTLTALHALERAATRAHDQDQPLVVVAMLDRALALLPADDRVNRWRALIGRAHARGGLHELEPALADLDTVLAEAAGSGPDRLVAKARVVRGEVLTLAGRYDEAAAELATAVQMGRDLDDAALTAEALRTAGANDVRRAALADAEPPIREALELYRQIGDRRGEAWALQNLAWIAFLAGDADVADRRLAKAKATFAEVGDAGGEGWALGLLAWVRFQQGRLEEAERLARVVIPTAEQRGERWPLAMMTVLIGQVALWQGRISDALDFAADARARFTEMGDDYGRIQSLVVMARALMAAGRIDEAWATVDEIRSTPDERDGVSTFGIGVEGALATFVGDPVRTRALADEARNLSGSGFGFGERRVTAGLALLQLGDVEAASKVLEALAQEDTSEGLGAYLAAPLALTRLARGDLDGARRAASAAIDTGTYLDRLSARLAMAMVELAAGDTTEATSHVEAARVAIAATGDAVAAALVEVAADLVDGVAPGDAGHALRALGLDAGGWVTALGVAAVPAGEPTN